MADSIDKNMIDKNEYPQAAEQDGSPRARRGGGRRRKQHHRHARDLGQSEQHGPGVRVSVPYALSTVVFWIYGYLSMVLS